VVEPRDPFEEFARSSGLRIATTELNAAPRDLAAPPDEHDCYTLVEVRRDGQECALKMLFITDGLTANSPSWRDVLWWLSSDAWAIEQADRDCEKWQAILRYPAANGAGARLFQLQLLQAKTLEQMLGEDLYRDLLGRYSAQLSKS
jgi:hypothetical protein